MHTLRALAVTLFVVWSPVTHLAQEPASSADVKALTGIIQATSRAIAANDPDGIMAHYSKDVIVSYPGIPDTTYDAFARSYRQMLSATTTTVAVPTIDEIVVSGDLAMIRLTWSTTITENDTRRVTSRQAKDLQVWRRENGAWKFYRGMWYHIKPAVG